jgi:hypothetical protein
MHTNQSVSSLLAIVLWACTGSDDALRSAQKLGLVPKAGATSNQSRQASAPGKCSLSPAQQIEAVKRFEELMPVIHHPRCANCHGGIDFFSPNYEELHGGGAVEMKDGEVKGPDGTIIARKRPDFKACQSCHDAAPGDFVWVVPHPSFDISFAGRTAGQICEQIKRHPPGDPNNLLRHIDADELIRLGFEGKRGHTSLSPLPPPMTAETFNAKVSDWIVAMKVQDEWPQPLSCGCVAPSMRYRVTVHTRTHTENYGEVANIIYNAEVQTDPSAPDDLIGKGRYSGHVISRKVNCHNNEPERKKTHAVSGNLDASGSVVELGEGPQLVYVLATTDWPVSPLAFAGDQEPSDPEMKEAVKGLGTITGPLLGVALQGPVTTKQEQRKGDLFETDCTGKVTTTEDITITDLSSSQPSRRASQ